MCWGLKTVESEAAEMNEVSTFRMYVLRALYAFVVAGLGAVLWPDILNPAHHWTLAEGEISCMLAAFSLMCVLGIRYPLQMLPALLWEIVWKTMWLLLVPLPQWRAGHVDEALKPTVFAISLVALVYLAVPWGYVYRHYVKAAGDRWRSNRIAA